MKKSTFFSKVADALETNNANAFKTTMKARLADKQAEAMKPIVAKVKENFWNKK